MKRWASVSVDLDEVHHYYGLHGLAGGGLAGGGLAGGGLAGGGASGLGAVYQLAIPRFEKLADALGIPLTFFAVGADARQPNHRARLKALSDAGYEVANHSLDHRYDLSRLSAKEMEAQVAGGARAIAEATGVFPVGFRAPGYLMNDRLARVLETLEVSYDSSVFACPSYYAAKSLALAAHRLRGRRSVSILGAPTVLGAPTRPYRLGRPYYRRGHGVLELPIQVTPRLRLPVIGTSLTVGGPRWARWLTRPLHALPFVNLELHGIDLLDAHDGLDALSRHQSDLRVPLARKLQVFEGTVRQLQQAGFEFVRLQDAARHLAASV